MFLIPTTLNWGRLVSVTLLLEWTTKPTEGWNTHSKGPKFYSSTLIFVIDDYTDSLCDWIVLLWTYMICSHVSYKWYLDLNETWANLCDGAIMYHKMTSAVIQTSICNTACMYTHWLTHTSEVASLDCLFWGLHTEMVGKFFLSPPRIIQAVVWFCLRPKST